MEFKEIIVGCTEVTTEIIEPTIILLGSNGTKNRYYEDLIVTLDTDLVLGDASSTSWLVSDYSAKCEESALQEHP